MWLLSYICKKLKLSVEQRYWLSWLLIAMKNECDAWTVFNYFQNVEDTDIEKISDFIKASKEKLNPQVYFNVKHIPFCDMFESYKWFSRYGQDRGVQRFLYENDPDLHFSTYFDRVRKNFYGFKYYQTWKYLHAIKVLCNAPVFPFDFRIRKENIKQSGQTHLDGLWLALGYDHKVGIKARTFQEVAKLESLAAELLNDAKEAYPHLKQDMNFFTLEAAALMYNHLWRKEKPVYLGYFLHLQAEKILIAEKDWSEISFELFWEARTAVLDSRLDTKQAVLPHHRDYFFLSGHLDRAYWLFDYLHHKRVTF